MGVFNYSEKPNGTHFVESATVDTKDLPAKVEEFTKKYDATLITDIPKIKNQ